MQSVQGLLLGVCFAGVLGGIVHLLSPGGSTDRLLRLLVTLFVLASAVVPMRALLRFAADEPTAQSDRDAAADAVLRNVETAIEQVSRRVLDKYGCPDAQITVAAKNENGEAHASRFVITGVPPEKAQEIADEIYSLTGEMPRMDAGSSESLNG